MKLGKYCWKSWRRGGEGRGRGWGRRGVAKRRDRRWEQNKRRRSELWKQMSVRSRFKDGPDSVISEYDLASYYAHTHTHTHRPFVIQAGLYREAFTYQHYLSLCHSLLINLLLFSNPTPITRRVRPPRDPRHTETYTPLTSFT